MIKITADGLVYAGAPLYSGMVREFDAITEAMYVSTGKAISVTAQTTQAAVTNNAISVIPQLSGGINKNLLKILGRNNVIFAQGGTLGTDFSATGRQIVPLKGNISRIQVYFAAENGLEGAAGVPGQIVTASVEGASGVSPLTFAAAPAVAILDSSKGGAWSDVVGISGLGGSNIYVRTFKRQPKAPTGGAAVAVNGGNLTTATQYFYKLTTVDLGGVESTPATEFSATATSPNLTMSITWTAPTTGYFVNIYRSLTTGTEKFLAQVPIAQTSFADQGVLTPNAALSPPAGNPVSFDRTEWAGESANSSYAGGAGTDVTGTTGAITGSTGPSGTFMPTSSLILGDDLANPAVLWLGDSIGYGTGIYKFNFGNQSPQLGNMFDASFANGQFAGTTNAAIPSARLDQLLSGATSGWIRLKLIQYADYVINQLGTNDLVNGQTWQQLASNHLRLAALVVASGGRYAATTIIPRTTSTDGWRTASNQAVLSSESNRVNYNTWLRNGSQVDVNLNPVLSGGTSSPYMYGFIDIASALEVNSANILTQNGGFWQAPTAAAFNQIATGVPTTTSLPASAANYPLTTATNLGVCTYTLQMTSGGANGQLAVVTSNTATTLTLFANGNTSLTGVALPGLTIAPAAADTFSLWLTSTVDGVHGLWPSYQICAATVGAWLSSRIVKYGAMLGI